MASRSLKEIARALNGVFASTSNVRSLPKEIHQSINTFLDKQYKIEDEDSHRLHEDLLAIWNKYIAKEEDKLGAFLQALRLLRPAIKGQMQLEEWWKLAIKPTIDALGHKRIEIEQASEFLLGILDYDVDEDEDGERAKECSFFSELLLEAYLKRSRIPSANEESLTPEDKYVAGQLEHVLIAFGRKKPKDFMLAADRLIVDKSKRAQALALLCTFVRHQPAHLYLVSQTPLFEHLLKCLMIDTSTTVIALALTTLIMFLPHIPSSVIAHLPRLFLIYSRLLCWDSSAPVPSEYDKHSTTEDRKIVENGEEQAEDAQDDETWEKLHSTFEIAETTTPELMHFFTFLYGLYPLNLMSYIRKPREYLMTIKFPNADVLDLDEHAIRSRTEQFRYYHLLHPNFYNTTLQDELTNQRWLKSDPSDVVAECMGLYCTPRIEDPGPPGPPPTTKLPDVPWANVQTEDIPPQSLPTRDDDISVTDSGVQTPSDTKSKNSWRDTQSTVVASPLSHKRSQLSDDATVPQSPAVVSPPFGPRQEIFDSPTLPPAAPLLSKGPYSQRSVSNTSFHSASEQSSRLSDFSRALMPRSPAVRAANKTDANMAFLQREVMLLRNDLNFERYLKQQHLSYIGQFQRKHINEATAEAQTQNLINNNHALKAKLAKANETYNSVKLDIAASRSQSKKAETELSARVRTLYEDERKWRVDQEALRVDLRKLQTECNHLRRLVVVSEAKELLAQQKVASMELDLEQLEDLRARLRELEERVRTYEAKEIEYEQANDERDILRNELAAAELRVQSKDSGQDRIRKSYDRKIADLDFRLQDALAAASQTPSVQHVIETTNAKFTTLKKEHAKLRLRYVELEMRCQELQLDTDAADAHDSSSIQAQQMKSPHPLKTEDPDNSFIPSYPSSIASTADLPAGGRIIPGRYEPIPMRPPPPSSSPAASLAGSAPAVVMRAPPLNTGTGGGSGDSRMLARAKTSVSRLTRTPSSSVRSVNSDGTTGGGGGGGGGGGVGLDASNKSSWSLDSLESKDSRTVKEKVTAKSEVRVYGRGGAQNIGKTKKDEEEKKREKRDKKDKGALNMGGLRGMRGIL